MAKGVPIQGRNPSGNAQIANVTAEGDLKVTLSGNLVQLWGNVIGDRPDYTTITVPTAFTLLNSSLDTWITDGTADWVEV